MSLIYLSNLILVPHPQNRVSHIPRLSITFVSSPWLILRVVLLVLTVGPTCQGGSHGAGPTTFLVPPILSMLWPCALPLQTAPCVTPLATMDSRSSFLARPRHVDGAGPYRRAAGGVDRVGSKAVDITGTSGARPFRWATPDHRVTWAKSKILINGPISQYLRPKCEITFIWKKSFYPVCEKDKYW
jgi:hypothetical protein